MSQKQFKVRCSSLGVICAKKGFAQTGMSEVKKEVQAMIYGVQRDIKSKYLSKGNVCEADSIDMLNSMLGVGIQKNETHYENDYIQGTPDYIEPDFCRDVKNSFDETTFPLLDDTLDYMYEWQMKGYLWLLGMKNGSIDYFLNDMPDELVEKEAWYKVRKLGLTELDIDLYDEVKESYTFSILPLHMRYKSFPVTLTEADIEYIKLNVTLANEYGNSLLKKYYSTNKS